MTCTINHKIITGHLLRSSANMRQISKILPNEDIVKPKCSDLFFLG
jgi:hypothetical protein